ncbi:RNI-like protein [Coemansia reversa NRRL 1564]|uniref:RNI-like protein n=1 Tax=Coemansia reversa (strain ATCC 12441 / NRRL 1564) TaxID=763665 RepID=A0A2G5B8K3_COERN|nr:RNI-like protein [Coemansia reversa NRRL 1564]|eukprot:PIA15363.1 RNI-like protein [Coemansia reversa NRRL 1564]
MDSVNSNLSMHVWNNDVIFKQIMAYLYSSQSNLCAVSLTNKRGWCYGIKELWRYPSLENINQFRLLVETAGHKLLIQLGKDNYYGELLRCLDLSVNIKQCDLVDYNSLTRLFQYSYRLEFLDITLCTSIKSSEFEQMLCSKPEMCKSLDHFSIPETNFSTSSIQSVLRTMPNLYTLDFTYTMVNDEILSTIAESNPKLRYLVLEDCPNITNYGVRKVVDACLDLYKLDLRRCPNFSDYEYRQLDTNCPYILEMLDLSYSAVDDILLYIIAESNPKLRNLYLEGCVFVTNYGVKKIVDSCLELRFLDVKNCPNFSDSDYVKSRGIRLDWVENKSAPEVLDFSDTSESFHVDYDSYSSEENYYYNNDYNNDDYDSDDYNYS